MWTWDQSAGELTHDGAFAAKGYSGRGRGKNNPSMQAAVGVGPCPQGLWRMGEAFTHPKLGRVAIPLSPEKGTETFGRTAFYIHGDSISDPGNASHGCIILPYPTRLRLTQSSDKLLQIVA